MSNIYPDHNVILNGMATSFLALFTEQMKQIPLVESSEYISVLQYLRKVALGATEVLFREKQRRQRLKSDYAVLDLMFEQYFRHIEQIDEWIRTDRRCVEGRIIILKT